MEKLITVIIPTTGRLEKLKRAIESLYAQSVSDYEIIVINDGCSIEVSNYIQKQNDHRLVYLEGNYGSGAIARNIGINSAKGGYISFLDDDDMYEPDKLDKQLQVLQKYNYDVAVCGSRTLNSNIKYLLSKDHDITKQLKEGNPYNITLMCKADILRKNLMDETLSNYQDWDLLVRLIKLNVKIHYIPEMLYVIDDGDHTRITNTVGFCNDLIEDRLKALHKHKEWLGTIHFKDRCFKEEIAYIRKRKNKKSILINAVRKYGTFCLSRYVIRRVIGL
ncbi:MAG: glycosyltransferase family 2 protein [Candidatus Thiodiazotropha sp.]